MNFKHTLIFTLILVSCSAPSTMNADKEEQLTELRTEVVVADSARELDEYLMNEQYNGVILVAKDGKVLLKKGYGYADYPENQRLLQEDTPFRIGSLTKQFTAAGILLLKQEGLLQVDDGVTKYLPDHKNLEGVTIHHLLTHTSGLPWDIAEEPQDNNLSKEELIQATKKIELLFEPGSDFGYSNLGYQLLGLIIETVSDVPYEKYITDNILTKANMQQTDFSVEAFQLNKERAIGYDPNDRRNSDKLDSYQGIASGDTMFSTLEDMLLWDNFLYNDEFLTSASKKVIFTDHISNSQGLEGLSNGYGYGYGWEINRDQHHVMVHSGYRAGFSSFIYRDTNEKFLLVFFSNVGRSGGDPVFRGTPFIAKLISD
ncbi:serine hydrolase domain-containing protein [Bacillus alkalicellulosilyticus]|uniref:serine hydrolase domain-containing protein n=1 Tax=Alkalihalobacterium alkalicellulosilyticum TaxID=1912214 RepID=UPI00148309FC|nr:serine hydrolase domain-containing protein [Bacillus alkalicellulosilyticus]